MMVLYRVINVVAIVLLLSSVARALPILRFDKMNQADRSRYVALLIQGAAKGLADHGQDEQSRKLIALFEDPGPKGGGYQLGKNLQIARDLDKQNQQPTLEVENALAVTMKDNGIVVPVSFLLTINKDFKASTHTPPQ